MRILMKSKIVVVSVIVVTLVIGMTASYAKDIEITFMRDTRTEKIDDRSIERYEKDYPNVKVKVIPTPIEGYWDKVWIMIAAGEPVDISYWAPPGGDWLNTIRKGFALDITQYINRDKDFYDKWYPITVEAQKFEDKYWSVPIITSPYLTWYNKEVFDKAGVVYPTNEWTWDDFLDTAKNLSMDTDNDGKIDVFGCFSSTWYGWRDWVKNNGGYVLDPKDYTKCVLDSEPAIEGLEFAYDLMWKYNVSPAEVAGFTGGVSPYTLFNSTGKFGMLVAGNWLYEGQEGSPYSFGVVLPPIGKAGRMIRTTAAGYIIASITKYPDQAYKLAQYLSGEEAQLDGMKTRGIATAMPHLNTDYGKNVAVDNFRENFLKAMGMESFLAVPGYPVEAERALNTAFDLMWLGKKTVRETIELLVPEMNRILEEFWRGYQ